MNPLFGDSPEVFFRLPILGNEQDISAERVRDTELQYHIGIKPGKVDDDVRRPAELVPDGAQDVGLEHLIAADVLYRSATSFADDSACRARPVGTERRHMKASF